MVSGLQFLLLLFMIFDFSFFIYLIHLLVFYRSLSLKTKGLQPHSVEKTPKDHSPFSLCILASVFACVSPTQHTAGMFMHVS